MVWLNPVPTDKLFRLEKRTVAGNYPLILQMKSLELMFCLVTGASGGLGCAVAEAIIESGGDVIMFDVMDKSSRQASESRSKAPQKQVNMSY